MRKMFRAVRWLLSRLPIIGRWFRPRTLWDGLVGCWVADENGRLVDISGRGNHGRIHDLHWVGRCLTPEEIQQAYNALWRPAPGRGVTN